MSPLTLRLIVNADLDSYEAKRTARLARLAAAYEAGFVTAYQAARASGDELGMRRIEALAADFDAANKDLPPVADELDGLAYPAAA
jgi:hypothetical protein